MKRYATWFLLFFLICDSILCMPAFPKRISISINGKDYAIKLLGDEHNKRAETEDGYTIIQDDNHKWHYAGIGSDSTLVASPWKVGDDKNNEAGLKKYLATVSKHLSGKPCQVSRNIESQRLTKKAIGKRRVLVILMEYQDLYFHKKQHDFERLFNEEGYSDDNAQGSVRDFFLASSYNQLQLESDIFGPYQTSENMSYYGRNNGMSNGQDVNAYGLFTEAVNQVSQDVDLSIYDGDGDGYLDNVHIIFAGYGEEVGANSDAIWSHEATLYRPYEIQGIKIDRYSCAPELRGKSGNGISRIGPHCHEIGHALGAMDFYDTNYSTNGQYVGTGDWDVMASGSWNNEGITPADFNPYVKAYNFGWITPKTIPSGVVTIAPSYLDAQNYYILKDSEYSDYYLVENRSKKKWGAGLPGEGLLFFHIHSDITNAGNEINIAAPQKCYVVCASSKTKRPNTSPASYGDINSAGCPFPGASNARQFGQSSIPYAFYWDSDDCGIEIGDIRMVGENIVMTNKSIGTIFEPIDRERLFFEDFEDKEHLAVVGWEESAWKIVENPENTMSFIDKPIAYEGVRCLQLSARDSKEAIVDSFRIHCHTNDLGKIRMILNIASLHVRLSSANIVTIAYYDKASDIYRYMEIKSSENNKWRQSFVEFPEQTGSDFIIIGKAYAGSILAIDNIEIEQEIVDKESPITDLSSITDKPLDVYSLDGRKLSRPQHGFNILKTKDGQILKIIIK